MTRAEEEERLDRVEAALRELYGDSIRSTLDPAASGLRLRVWLAVEGDPDALGLECGGIYADGRWWYEEREGVPAGLPSVLGLWNIKLRGGFDGTRR
jgi:hypothetical protein